MGVSLKLSLKVDGSDTNNEQSLRSPWPTAALTSFEPFPYVSNYVQPTNMKDSPNNNIKNMLQTQKTCEKHTHTKCVGYI
jgi:hypothetical protein